MQPTIFVERADGGDASIHHGLGATMSAPRRPVGAVRPKIRGRVVIAEKVARVSTTTPQSRAGYSASNVGDENKLFGGAGPLMHEGALTIPFRPKPGALSLCSGRPNRATASRAGQPPPASRTASSMKL